MGCLSLLSVAGLAQSSSRVPSGTPRWAQGGSIEIMEGDLAKFYGSADSAAGYKQRSAVTRPNTTNPHATRFTSVQAQCDAQSVLINWMAVQQPGTDRYEIEQSDDDGVKWKLIGTVPASQVTFNESSYTFNYYKNAGDVVFRIAAVSAAGEKQFSYIIQSPCSPESYFNLTPNPIYSTSTLRLGSPTATKARMLLVNSGGVVVQKRDLSLSQGMNTIPVDMSALLQGYYTLTIAWMGGKQDVINVIKR
jgi:hypothetical protein